MSDRYKRIRCPQCKGLGSVVKKGKMVRCPRCGGSGTILVIDNPNN